MKKLKKGILVLFEGGESCGKSTAQEPRKSPQNQKTLKSLDFQGPENPVILTSVSLARFSRKEKRGFFVVIEGNDGAGKTTQLSLLADYLKEKGKDIYVTREQSNSKYGKKISELVVSEEGERLTDEEWLELYTLDRIEHLKKEVLPALRQGKIVVCSRYDYSTCIYQLKDESKWKSYISKFPRPDLTFVIIVPTKIALERLHKRDRKITVFEKEKMIEERREKYLRILSIGDNIKEIDGSRDVQGVFSQIKKRLMTFLE